MNKLNLNNVTCVIVDGYNPANKCAQVLNYASKLCDFHSIKLFSFEQPTIPFNFEFIKIDKMTHIQYSIFMIQNLPKYIESEYVLIMQNDGYIVDINKWDNDFLKYDYIGAPWHPGTLPNTRVGNGGFSLRSKKLLQSCLHQDFIMQPINEDITICSLNKDLLELNGLKFAPIDVAAKFSWGGDIPEINRNWNDCFGAHMTNNQDFYNLLQKFTQNYNND